MYEPQKGKTEKHSSGMRTREGTTPGGREYKSIRDKNHKFPGKYTEMFSGPGQSSYYRKNTELGKTTKTKARLPEAEEHSRAKPIKKGPTKPVLKKSTTNKKK